MLRRPFIYFILSCLIQPLLADPVGSQPLPDAATEETSTEPINHLSYTRFGWRNVDYWKRRPQVEFGIDRVHPITWSALLVLAVLMAVFWSASEVELVWDNEKELDEILEQDPGSG